MDYIGLVNAILEDVDESAIATGSFASATGLAKRAKRWVNLVCNDIFSRSNDWAWSHGIGTINTVANTESYSLPSDAVPDTIKVLYFNDTREPLWYWDYEEWFRNYNRFANVTGGVADKGQPSDYTVLENKIYFWPIPDKVYTFKFPYQKKHTDLSGSTDTPIIPAEWHHVIVSGGLAKAKKFLGDDDWQAEKNEYEHGIKLMLGQNRRYIDRAPAARVELDYYDGWDLD